MEQQKQRALLHKETFLTRRTSEMKHEMLWVMKGVPLPKKQPAPPDWAICAIKRVAETSLKPLYEIDPGNPQNITRSNAIKMAGILQSLLFILKSPGQAAKAEEKESPEIKMLREKLSAMVPKELAGLLKKIGKASQHIKTADGSANLEQFQDDLANLMEGASSLVAPDCEFVEGRSMTAKLYLQIWVLWPCQRSVKVYHPGSIQSIQHVPLLRG